MTAQLHFLAYVREGLAAAGAAPDPLDEDIPSRQPVTVGVRLTGRAEHHFDVRLYGPGDVRGVDPRQIIRLDPPPAASDFEPNNLASIEFDRPDFPWLFTPAAAGSRQRLRPWLFLVVVPVANSALRTDTGAPLPVLECGLAELPDLSESWAWAHAQVAATEGESVSSVLAADPTRTLSRLVSPRRLAAGVAYRACLVPAFEPGRLAGLGLAVDDSAPLAPAWSGSVGPAPALPVYHSWEFSTGADGDFESLVRRLRARALPDDAGLRPVLVGRIGVPDLDPSVPTVTLGVEGALRGALTMPTVWTPESREPVQRLLRELIGDTGQLLGPPLYGGVHAGVDRVPEESGLPRWLRELNLDPRHRVAAALGARIVRERQEELMAAAWEQAAAVQRANEALRQAELAVEASRSAYERRIVAGFAGGPALTAGPPTVGRLLQLSGSVLGAVTVSPRSKRLIGTQVEQNPTAAATLSAPFRRMTRPGGPLARRFGPQVDLGTVVAAAASNAVTATPPARPPAGTVLFDDVAGDDISFTRINRQRFDTAETWWRRPAALLAGPPTRVAPVVDPAPEAGAASMSPIVDLAPTAGIVAVPEDPGPPALPMRPPPDRDPRDPPPDPDPEPDPIPPPEPLPVVYPDTAPLPAGVPGEPTGLPSALLSPPGVAPDDRRMFVNSADGRLFERYFDGTRWLWLDRGAPPGTQAAGVEPGGFMDGGRRMFVASVHGRLFERYWASDQWLWRQHPDPPNSYGLGTTPALVLNNQSVFLATTMNGSANIGRLWERRRDGDTWSWVDHGNPGGTEKILSQPWAAIGNTRFFVRTNAGKLWERQWNGTRWLWVDRGRPTDASVADVGPAFGNSVFVKTHDGRLFEWRSLIAPAWLDHGRPAGGEIVNMTYELMVIGAETSLFVGASDGRLHQRVFNGAAWQWVDRGNPPGTRVMQPPGAVIRSRRMLHVTGSNGNLFSLHQEGSSWLWTDHGGALDSRGSGPAAAEPAADTRWALPLGFLSNLVVAHVDNPERDNYIHHRVGRDLGFEAEVRGGWSAPVRKPTPIGWETQGLGIAVADVNGSGRPDLILMWVDNPAGANTVRYQVGWDLDAAGQVTGGWSPEFRLPDEVAAEVQGADLALADLDGDGRPELILAYVTGGASGKVHYRVGWRLDTTGEITRGWSDSVPVQDLPWPVQGVGVAVADLDDNGTPDLVVLAVGPYQGATQAVYRIGRKINPRGRVAGGWSSLKTVGGGPLPTAHQGAGIAVMDVTGTRRADLVFFHLANPALDNQGYYRVGWDLDGNGNAAHWSADAPVPGWFGWESQGAAVAVADLDPQLTAVRTAMGDRFFAAAGRHQDRVLAAQALAKDGKREAFDAVALAARVSDALHPVEGITERMVSRLEIPGSPAMENLRQLVVVPRFPQPMYELLRDLSQNLLFPGVSDVPPETVTVLRVNAAFVEAFMVGLNAELGREMLWRRYPTDPRATFVHRFWDLRADDGSPAGLPPVAGWQPDRELGGNSAADGPGDMLVVLVRGELLRRYPGTEIYVQRAGVGTNGRRTPTGEVRAPRFTGRLQPDIHFFGLPLSVTEARGGPTGDGWFVMLRQPPVDARFGLDAPAADTPYGGTPASWADLHWRHLSPTAADDRVLRHVPVASGLNNLHLDGLGWGYNSAHQARILLQPPVLVAVHASDMVPAVDDSWRVEATVQRTGGVDQDRIVALGGRLGDGSRWRMSTEEVIAAISRQERFLVEQPTGRAVRVRVSRTGEGRAYLTTEADGEIPNNLLSLPELAEDAS
ncbi:DUF3892 domain-containing protein [Micromonospora sp. NPDC051296]|uniref:FG-GAP-like repeat-containing protein n=1 Tax=Micromonospora sp. NPDC051296 TaxID=3155046 RepID=UPI00342F2F96